MSTVASPRHYNCCFIKSPHQHPCHHYNDIPLILETTSTQDSITTPPPHPMSHICLIFITGRIPHLRQFIDQFDHYPTNSSELIIVHQITMSINPTRPHSSLYPFFFLFLFYHFPILNTYTKKTVFWYHGNPTRPNI